MFKEVIDFVRELYHEPKGFIPLHAPVFLGNEKKYLEECIDSTYVSSVGKFVDLFEEKIAEYTGAKKAVVCVNGTNALHLALKMAGVERDSEVITQPLTFIATANAIAYCDAHPVFLDVDLDTMGLSPVALRNWLENNIELRTSKSKPRTENREQGTQNPEPINIKTGRRISACLPMHTFGHPCKIDEIVEICNQFLIPVVEDAAESLGSFYKEQHTGTYGRIGVLSFNGNKILTTGGGGMLIFKDEDLGKKAKHLTTQAKIPHPWEFEHDEIGYNYRMPNINAALGLAQLEQLSGFLENKRETAKKYSNFFKATPYQFFSEPKNARSNFWLNVILMNDRNERDDFLNYSNEHGVMTRPAWQLMNKLPMFQLCQTDNLKNAYNLMDRIVNIPSGVSLGIKHN
jgi:aminotransferase in exopolysaccharide biosynthesis